MKTQFNYTYDKRAITAAELNNNVPDEVVVDKADFEIEAYLGGYYSIKGCLFGKEIEVLGGDSANEDDYDRDFFEKVYDEWDGTLVNDCGNFRIEL